MRFPKATFFILFIATAASLALLPTLQPNRERTAQAHQVEIVEDVGATLHIEPNDTPRAGEETLAWFALTRRGGQTIPLADCDCQLAVYTQPKGDAAELTPTLITVDAEGYQDIPGAQLTFPTVGAYTLVMSGSPKQAEDFSPFELSFDVTVAAGQSAPESPANLETSADETSADNEEISEKQAADTTVSALEVSPTEPEAASQGWAPIVFFSLLGISVVFLIGTAILQKQNKQKP